MEQMRMSGDSAGAEAAGEGTAQRSVQSVEVGGRLLLALADSRSDLSLKDLAARAGLTPSRAHPYLVSFSRLGLVEQREATGRYGLGPAALQIGLAALHQLDPIQAASPVAEALAARTGHAVALAVWGNFGPTVVRLIEARQPLHVMLRAGSVMSLTGTATGRAFVAAWPLERLEHASPAAMGEAPGARPTRVRLFANSSLDIGECAEKAGTQELDLPSADEGAEVWHSLRVAKFSTVTSLQLYFFTEGGGAVLSK
jgi:hypothetical protein